MVPCNVKSDRTSVIVLLYHSKELLLGGLDASAVTAMEEYLIDTINPRVQHHRGHGAAATIRSIACQRDGGSYTEI